jgi:hypothetical protein
MSPQANSPQYGAHANVPLGAWLIRQWREKPGFLGKLPNETWRGRSHVFKRLELGILFPEKYLTCMNDYREIQPKIECIGFDRPPVDLDGNDLNIGCPAYYHFYPLWCTCGGPHVFKRYRYFTKDRGSHGCYAWYHGLRKCYQCLWAICYL